MHLSDRVTGAVVVAVGVLALYGGSLQPKVPGQDVGPAVFPMVVGCGLVACGLAIAFGIGRSFEPPEAEAPGAAAPSRLRGLLALLPPAVLIFYVLTADRLGFLIAGGLVVLATSLAMGARLRLAVPLAVAAPLVIHLAFAKLLRVPLPDGLLAPPW